MAQIRTVLNRYTATRYTALTSTQQPGWVETGTFAWPASYTTGGFTVNFADFFTGVDNANFSMQASTGLALAFWTQNFSGAVMTVKIYVTTILNLVTGLLGTVEAPAGSNWSAVVVDYAARGYVAGVKVVSA